MRPFRSGRTKEKREETRVMGLRLPSSAPSVDGPQSLPVRAGRPLSARCAPYPFILSQLPLCCAAITSAMLGALNEQRHNPGCYRGSTLPVERAWSKKQPDDDAGAHYEKGQWI